VRAELDELYDTKAMRGLRLPRAVWGRLRGTR